jgi:hypothetical protein
VDAFVTFLLAAFASMVFISLNWWPHPIRWFRSLTRPDKFTFVVACFTVVLALATCVNVWAFIQSERAFLVVDNLRFLSGEPTTDGPFPLILTIQNPGRNVATVKEIKLAIYLGLHHQQLPDEPDYTNAIKVTVLPSIGPGLDHQIPIRGTLNVASNFRAQVVSDLLSGEDSFYVFGEIQYDNGYNVIGVSEVGFCFSYAQPSQRFIETFEACDKSKYTYTRSRL